MVIIIADDLNSDWIKFTPGGKEEKEEAEKRLPLWRSVFDSAKEKYGEKLAESIAFAMIRKSYKDEDGKYWVAREIIKGGEGSGFFGHAGRPGHQGGSLPSGKDVTDKVQEMMAAGLREATMADLLNTLSPLEARLNNNIEEVAISEVPLYATGAVRAQMKQSIVDTLEKEYGIDPEVSQGLLDQWSRTATDNDLGAIRTQIAASQLLGVPLGDYINAKIQNWGTDVNDYRLVPHNAPALVAIRDNTAKWFSDNGLSPDDTVTLYRGVVIEDESLWPSLKAGRRVNISGNPLESWTSLRAVGLDFAPGRTHARSFVFKAQVPIRRIISTARTGMGCLKEAEFVIEGATPLLAEVVHEG
ncbi:MAG: ChaB family protein [Sphaerochaeta sp.]|jgi:hypothetical protein|nr:ChaB family protein [Sphaerochaeta sp.]